MTYQLTSSNGEWWTGDEWSTDRAKARTYTRVEARNMQALVMGLPEAAGVYLRQSPDSIMYDLRLSEIPDVA